MALELFVDRVINLNKDGTVSRFIKGTVDSTDVKPVNHIVEQSSLYEKDAGKWYLFNEKMQKWLVPDDNAGGPNLIFLCIILILAISIELGRNFMTLVSHLQ